ncbi:MAG: endonuclease domain-containing protein [Clostridia bacterium]|nr:endonuclease domain-containing protein [Clostridia bacterium]
MPVMKNNRLLPYARDLRREMTPHERKLWYLYLRKYPVKIYKQRIIDSFIVDFYCARAKLVIEVDGSQHYTPEGLAYDRERTARLAQYDLSVLRFSNNEIEHHFDVVCRQIDMEIQTRVWLCSV